MLGEEERLRNSYLSVNLGTLNKSLDWVHRSVATVPGRELAGRHCTQPISTLQAVTHGHSSGCTETKKITQCE